MKIVFRKGWRIHSLQIFLIYIAKPLTCYLRLKTDVCDRTSGVKKRFNVVLHINNNKHKSYYIFSVVLRILANVFRIHWNNLKTLPATSNNWLKGNTKTTKNIDHEGNRLIKPFRSGSTKSLILYRLNYYHLNSN